MKRVESLDYLRGIMAVSVMLYHYFSWSFGTLGSETLLGKLGIYAVSIFYILSGLSLAIVYDKRINNVSDVGTFFIKRLFRIFPLFWLVVTASIVLKYLSSQVGNSEFDVTVYTVFLNYSLLFGFFEPTAYLSTGAWSIGNEMVFYLILPFVFFLNNKNKLILPFVILCSFAIGLFFSFELLDPEKPLTEQWSIYINPFNQIFLFMAGVAIGKWGNRISNISDSLAWSLIGLTLLLFVFWPAQGDKIQIITGIERWLYSFLSVLLVLIVYVLNPKLSSWRHKVFSFLGQGCYSIYLIHPIVSMPIVYVFSIIGLGNLPAYTLSFILTLVFSWFSFKYIESPMMKYGKKLIEEKRRKKVSLETRERAT